MGSSDIKAPDHSYPYRGNALHMGRRTIGQRDDGIVGIHLDDRDGAIRIANGLQHRRGILCGDLETTTVLRLL